MTTMNDVLGLLLQAADDVGRSFDHSVMATWPPGALEELQRLKFLRRSAGGLYATCPNCSNVHGEPVSIVGDQYFISCPESMIVEVEPEMCESWEVDPSGFASAVHRVLQLKGKPKEVMPDRLWKLGRTSWPAGGRSTREVVFARRMYERDASSVVAHLDAGGRAIVLVPHVPPDKGIFPGRVPAVITLSQVATIEDRSLCLDVLAMAEAVKDADRAASMIGGLTLTERELNAVIRRHVKAEQKATLTDDAVVQAYKIHQNARATAEALRKEGYPIHHSTVARKVKAAEEAGELRETRDSASVGRSVASRRSDRAKKFIERR